MQKDLPPLSQTAEQGLGPLLQKDYWTVIKGCELGAQEVANFVSTNFCILAPQSLASFCRKNESPDSKIPLKVGEVLDIKITLYGDCQVRVVHADKNSITLGTLEGHPEAGKITFGCYPNDQGEIIYHIRSIARAGQATAYAGFWVLGDGMQTSTWVEFIDRVVASLGKGPPAIVNAETAELDLELAHEQSLNSPTFTAQGN